MECDQNNSFSLTPQKLPSEDFDKMRRKLVLPLKTRQQISRFANLFSFTQKTNTNSTPLNNILILQGPPGCGKSMTGIALAQVLAERHLKIFNKQSFFFPLHGPMFFSEFLGKTMRNFSDIFDIIKFSSERRQTIVLVDEIESLCFSRAKTSTGDPSDVIRAVNELLRHADSLRGNPNFLLIASTNMSELLDDAFKDRADYILTFDNPDVHTGAMILYNAAKEAGQLGIRLSQRDLQVAARALCCHKSKYRPSGRLLSKLPLLAYIESGLAQPSSSTLVETAHIKMRNGAPV
jgi:SpoVK/Ycf46/Vps4 family AAA+-type ATPase